MLQNRKLIKYGWRPDLPDHRDYVLSYSKLPRPVVPHFDMRTWCAPVFDQGQYGSCTANAICGLDEFVQMRENIHTFRSSRMFLYYNERDLEGTTGSDSGAMIRDGMACLANQGVPLEDTWQYTAENLLTKPSQEAYDQAAQHKSISYWRVPQTANDMINCLLQEYPFVFGFTVYDSFESDEVAQTGIVNLPQPGENVVGGHAVMCVGYDTVSQRFIVRNSWGTGWGQSGYFTMPFAYMTNPSLSSDFWTLRKTN